MQTTPRFISTSNVQHQQFNRGYIINESPCQIWKSPASPFCPATRWGKGPIDNHISLLLVVGSPYQCSTRNERLVASTHGSTVVLFFRWPVTVHYSCTTHWFPKAMRTLELSSQLPLSCQRMKKPQREASSNPTLWKFCSKSFVHRLWI